MNSSDINNYFGDIDLYLMDAILKGVIPEAGKVLDIGCGEGRNGIYFLRQGFEYVGLDRDHSKIKLMDYLVNSLVSPNARFEVGTMESAELGEAYDLIICSRVLHFAKNRDEFRIIWDKISQALNRGGIVYLAMDSAMNNAMAKPINDLYEFPDGRRSYALDVKTYDYMLQGFREVEDLKTILYKDKRAQSIGILEKI